MARDAEEAQAELLKILKQVGARTVVKSKSMTTEEVHVNEALAGAGIESIEDRSREFIVQLREEHPYHIVTPAMHLRRKTWPRRSHEKYQLPIESTPKKSPRMRKTLREKYQRAEVGITGANFLIADTGGVQ